MAAMKPKMKMGASVSDSAKKAPYHEAKDALARLIAEAADQAGAAPLSLSAAVLEEAFCMLQATILGKGLDEETLSSAFMASLASAGRFWSTCWIWQQQEQSSDICWIHYNKKSESRIGADFALLVATPGNVDEQPGFRMMVIQAKLQTDEVKRLSIEQSPDLGKKLQNGDRNAKAEIAEQALRNLLDDLPRYKLDVAQDHFQLSKLLELRNRFRALKASDGVPEPDILYAIWPASCCEPLYRMLAEAVADIRSCESEKADEPTTNTGEPAGQRRKITQSIKLDYKHTLRHWLLSAVSGGGGGGGGGGNTMDARQAKAAFDAVNELCTATIIVDLSGAGLGLDLLKEAGQAPAPALEPAIPAPTVKPPTLDS